MAKNLYLVRNRDINGGIIEVFEAESREEVKKAFESDGLEVIDIINIKDLGHGDEIALLP